MDIIKYATPYQLVLVVTHPPMALYADSAKCNFEGMKGQCEVL